MTLPNTEARKTRRILLGIYGAALLYFVLKLVYYALGVGGFPDSTAQVSYLIEMSRAPALIPDFANMPMYNVLSRDGLSWTMEAMPGVINYMGHPPLYYLLMSLTGAVRFLPEGTAAVDMLRLYAANIALSSAAVILAFRLGYRRLRGKSPVVHALFALAVTTLPELGYVGASVNNDNLAFFALVLFFTGVVRYDEDKQDLKTYLLIGIGFLLGSFSKLTMALIMIFMLVTILVMSIIRTKSLKLIANRYFLISLPCYGLFLAYELLIHRRFGGWQPSLALVAPEYYLTTVYYVAPENRVPMTFLQFVRSFAGGIGYSWSSLYGHNKAATAQMNNMQAGVIFWIPVAGTALAALLQLIRKQKADRYTIPVFAAFLLTMAYHLYSNWSGYLKSGYMGGAQARYYLPMIVPFALIFCERIPPMFRTKKAKTVGTVLAIILMILWLVGDAPRLLVILGLNPA